MVKIAKDGVCQRFASGLSCAACLKFSHENCTTFPHVSCANHTFLSRTMLHGYGTSNAVLSQLHSSTDFVTKLSNIRRCSLFVRSSWVPLWALELCLFSQWRFLYNSSGDMDTWHFSPCAFQCGISHSLRSREEGCDLEMIGNDSQNTRIWFVSNHGLELNSHRRQTMSQLWQQAWDLKHRFFDNVVPAAGQEDSAKTCCLTRSRTSAQKRWMSQGCKSFKGKVNTCAHHISRPFWVPNKNRNHIKSPCSLYGQAKNKLCLIYMYTHIQLEDTEEPRTHGLPKFPTFEICVRKIEKSPVCWITCRSARTCMAVSGPGDRCVTFASCLPRPDGDAHVAVCSPSATALSMKFLWGAGYSWTVSKTWTGKEKCFCFTTIIRTIPVHFLDKFSQVAQQTQQQGRRSINALRLCLTSAKNGGQCQ